MKWGCSLISIVHLMENDDKLESNDFGLSEKARWGPQDRCLVGFRSLGDTLLRGEDKKCKKYGGTPYPDQKPSNPGCPRKKVVFFQWGQGSPPVI